MGHYWRYQRWPNTVLVSEGIGQYQKVSEDIGLVSEGIGCNSNGILELLEMTQRSLGLSEPS